MLGRAPTAEAGRLRVPRWDSLTPGKLADLTVGDHNLRRIKPRDVLKMKVRRTIVDVKIA